jgi:tRNA-2-methylthio-N6-dimethylallyladenosine synthase
MRAQVGRRERILIENPSRHGGHQLMGRTDGFRPVIVPAAVLRPGELVEVTITGATHKTLSGELGAVDARAGT